MHHDGSCLDPLSNSASRRWAVLSIIAEHFEVGASISDLRMSPVGDSLVTSRVINLSLKIGMGGVFEFD